MIIPILFALLLLFVTCYVVKKEFFTDGKPIVPGKYTITEITKAMDLLLISLKDKHSLVRVNNVSKNSPYISFDCLLYNHNTASVKNYYAKVKIPLSSKGTYILETSYVSDSNEHIENGTVSIKDSQTYGNL